MYNIDNNSRRMNNEYSVPFYHSHVRVNLFTAVKPAVIFPTFTVAFEDELKNKYAGFHTALKASSVNELSSTTLDELANSVHVTLVRAATIAQSRIARDCLVPKNNLPDGVANDDTTPAISGGVTEPKTATSNVGMVFKDRPRRVSFVGGVAG